MKKTGKKILKLGAILIVILMVVVIGKALLSGNLLTTTIYASSETTLTFSNASITETISGSGYEISGTSLTITEAGKYRITGSCSEGNIEVSKGVTGVVLVLDNLILKSSTTAPIIIKKEGASATIELVGTSTITNTENPDNETSTDTEIADAFEGAAIKVKSASSLRIKGSGTLNVDGSTCKNGIKGAATSSIIIDSGNINVQAANNGIGCDGSVTINNGTINVTANGDGIKSEPESDDTSSDGAVTINGGIITVNVQGDGIQAANNLAITDGVFNIKTLDGYNSSSFNSDTMSCKGLKASTNEQEGVQNVIRITGGTFNINSADDAIHSDNSITITGGTFDIYTGDDAVHAETSLVLGTENGLDRDPDIKIYSSVEGLEACQIYTYSGKYYIISSDDGINAAGDVTKDYLINISGGDIYVNAEGDGMDSNKNISIYGGNMEIWGMKSGGDNSPIDLEGKLIIQNARVLVGGSRGMGYVHSNISNTNQNYEYSTTSYSSRDTIYIKDGNNIMYHTTVPKNVNYIFFTSPDTTSNYSISTSGSTNCETGHAWGHEWNNGQVTTEPSSTTSGVITYTCSVCGSKETQTVYYTGTEIEIQNKSNALATVTLGNESSTSDFITTTNEGKIKVECSLPCIVLITNDGGNTYTAIESILTEDKNTYEFSFDIQENLKIVVAIKGDVNFNGIVNAADAMLISRSNISNSANGYRALTAIEKMVADVNQNGEITAADVMLIGRSQLSTTADAYQELTW